MRRFVTALISCIVLALPLGVAASGPSALAAPHKTNVSQRQPVRGALAAPQRRLPRSAGNFYLCDGNGSGSCMSLPSGACYYCFSQQALYAVGKDAGAWTWWELQGPSVGSTSNYVFKDDYIEDALAGQPTWAYILRAAPDEHGCAANAAGGAVMNYSTLGCGFDNDETWVYDPETGWVVNFGRSNDQDNWEILCNPGGGAQLTVTTRDGCSSYHEEWAIVLAS